MTQSVQAAREALFVAMRDVIYVNEVDTSDTPVLVSYGKPATYQPDYIVGIVDTRRPIERPTMGTGRSRRSTVEIDVVFSQYVPGKEVAQQTASDACDYLVGLLETYFRTSPNERLGGACFDAWVSNVDGPKPNLIASKGGGVAGRTAESVATVSLRIDY